MNIKHRYRFHFIYKTTNNITGKPYIGKHSTDDLDDGYLGSGKYFNNSIKRYGKENFKREILEFCLPCKFYIKYREESLIKEHNSLRPNGYNLTENSGGGNLGELVNKKISEFASSRVGEKNPQFGKTGKLSPQFGAEGYWKGKKLPESVKQKRLETLANKPMVTCPWCSKTAKSSSNMTRYHFDNCKFNPINDKEEIERQRRENHPMRGKFGRKHKRKICSNCGEYVAVNIYAQYHGNKCKLKKY